MKLNSVVNNVIVPEKERLKYCFASMQAVYKAIEGSYDPTEAPYIKILEVLSAIQRAYGYMGQLIELAKHEPIPPRIDKYWSFDENGEMKAITRSEYEQIRPQDEPFSLN